MSFPVQFDPDARLEFLNAVDWYEREKAGLGAEFFDDVGSALREISSAPETFPPFSFSTRRFLLVRFPYCIVYRRAGAEIWIMAVAHTSRRPGYWKERL